MNLEESTFVTDVSWRELLLETPVDENFNDYYKSEAKAIARAFSDTLTAPTAAEVEQANQWYASGAGQKELCKLVDAVWAAMSHVAPHAMPAHDARHAMFKVPAYALFHMAAENVTGWERIGVLGALMHDYGRWAEERLFGGPGEGVIHARFSFLLTAEILAGFKLPSMVHRELLRAVLEHTSGAHPEDQMPLKLTVAADRDQLYGPEIVLRLAHHGVSDSYEQTSFYGEKPGTPILDRLKHFHDNRLSGPLYSLSKRTGQLQELLRQFILMAEPFEASKARWVTSPSSASTKAVKSNFGPEHWEGAWISAQTQAKSTRVSANAHAALITFLNAKHVAPDMDHLQVAVDKLSDLPADRAEYLANALDFMTSRRIHSDAQERKLLKQIRALPTSEPFICRLTDRLLADWPTA